MKKIVLAALALAAFGQANAQSFESASASTAMTMNLEDVITINATQPTMSATFATANDYGWHKQIVGTGSGSAWGQNIYQVQSNRFYNVTIELGNITYTGTQGYSGNNTSYAAGDVRFKLESAGNTTDGTPAVTTGAWVPFSGFNTPMNVLNHCPNTPNAGTIGTNTGRTFALSFLATPNWQYAGGTYTTDVTVTATQE